MNGNTVDDSGKISTGRESIRRRVLWQDGTLDRAGWFCRYATVGASIRFSSNVSATASLQAQCWIARTGGAGSTDEHVVRVIGVIRKILQRGSSPPLHPDVEGRLLRSSGLYESSDPTGLPGDLTRTLSRDLPPGIDYPPYSSAGDGVEISGDLAFGSEEERSFYTEWLFKNCGRSVQQCVIPQAPLESLLSTNLIDKGANRRVDFLVNLPDSQPFVIEIDGLDHDAKVGVDEERDDLLAGTEIDVVRIPAEEIRAGMGSSLDSLLERLSAPQRPCDDITRQIASSAIEIHRLVFALTEAVAAGYLEGDEWRIQLDGVKDTSLYALASYLDLLKAIDLLWAGDIIATKVLISSGGGFFEYFNEGVPKYVKQQNPPNFDRPDVIIRLEPEKTSVVTLPQVREGIPEVIVRSALIPVQIRDDFYEGSARILVRQDVVSRVESNLKVILRTVFAKEEFLPGQLDGLMQILQGEDCAVLLPTGGGKSLIYQLAGLCLPGRTIVVDPLVALIEDQVRGLQQHGIDRVTAITAYQVGRGDRQTVEGQVASGDALFVFVTPERFQRQSFRSAIRELSQSSPINLTVVDEAHCVSEWGHDFRTAYLTLGNTLRKVCRDPSGNPPPILALTGTASRAVLRDVLLQLGIDANTERSIVRPTDFDRPELGFSVLHTEPSETIATLVGWLRSAPGQFGIPPGEFFRARGHETHSGLIFCPHKNGQHGVVRIASEVTAALGLQTVIYAGGAPPREYGNADWEKIKRANADSFIDNEVPIMVATKAFGMGIDKRNIRYVVHYGIPGSIESYYQEVGRGGRDHENARCALIVTERNPQRSDFLTNPLGNLEEIRKTHLAIRRPDSDDVVRQLFFQLDAFKGVDSELAVLESVLRELGDLSTIRTIQIPMGDRSENEDGRERAIYRLMILGVVSDYRKEGRGFEIDVEAPTSVFIVDRLTEFVKRNQPGREVTLSSEYSTASEKAAIGAVLQCAQTLISFVYDVIERSRRRSFREMLEASRAVGANDDGIFRGRILAYLTQGDISPTLERLVDINPFTFGPWEEELDQVNGVDDARELRGSTARLLTSYPDHPGLLLARAWAEIADTVSGNLTVFGANLEASLSFAAERYGVTSQAVEKMMNHLIGELDGSKRPGLVTALEVGRKIGVSDDTRVQIEIASLREKDSNPGLKVMALASSMERTRLSIESILGDISSDIRK